MNEYDNNTPLVGDADLLNRATALGMTALALLVGLIIAMANGATAAAVICGVAAIVCGFCMEIVLARTDD